MAGAVCVLMRAQVREIEGEDLLAQGFPDLPVSDVLRLEGIANRDSLPYADAYGLGRVDELRTLVRGTIRCVRRALRLQRR